MGNQPGKERRDYGRRIDWKNAERPSPPGKPYLVPEEGDRLTDVITIRWSPPTYDGGAPVIGYLVEHRRTGSPHWLRAIPDLVAATQLPLTGLEPGWRYQFRVSAENDIGRSDPGELSEPLTVTPQKWAACAPFFNIELQDTIGLENEKVEFKVQVIAIPPATISWYKDGFEVFSSRRTKIITENDQSTFIIHQAALEDEGEIKCTATNRAGHAVTKANLKLEAPPRIRLPKQYEDGLLFEKGELIRLKATTAGRPKPEVQWYHNGELLKNEGRYEISESETGSMVKISDACREDRGEYVIRGVNKIGDDVASFLVTVTDRPSPPGKVLVSNLGKTVTLTWSSPQDDGGCKIGSYIVEYFRIGWDMWLKVKNSRQLSTTLDDLIEGSQYKFRVRAENPYGVSEPSQESDVLFIPDLKRGILTPPSKTSSSEILKETNKHVESQENGQSETEESKRRRLLEEKAKRLLDTPLSVLLPYENAPPPVPKRKKGKRSTPSPNLSDQSDATPSPMEVTRLTPSPVEMESKVETLNGRIQSSEWLTKSEELKKSGHLKFEEKDPMINEPSLYPRENDDSIMHGSSELMLVIYPRDRSKSVELSAQQRSEIEMNLSGEGVAPPISLSAPELGGAEIFEPPVMREAISSSEILYEKAMARLYKDSVEEEAQRKVKRRYSMDRKSVERRSSLKETIERRLSFKEEKPPKQEEVKATIEKKPEEFVSMIPKPKTTGYARERLSSVEKERVEFALVREKLKKKEEEQKMGMVANQESDISTTTPTSSSVDPEELEQEYEDSEFLEEEEEEDYLDGRKHAKLEDNDVDEDISTKPPIVEKLMLPKLTRVAPFAEPEDDTYHPQSMIPKRSIVTKLETPEVKRKPTKETSPVIIKEKPKEKEQISKIPVPSAEKPKKTSKILKKFGLKKTRKIPEVTLTPPEDSPNNQPTAIIPKPILKNKILTKKDSPRNLLRLNRSKSTDKSVSEEESESELGGRKKKQVRIAEPKEEEEALNKKVEKPIDQNAKENQVLIFHYSDIVKEFGAHKKPPTRLYLNYDELKAHANPEESSSKSNIISTKTETRIGNTNATSLVQSNSIEAETRIVEPKVHRQGEPEMKFRSTFEYITDVVMFIIALWLYLFQNELYAIPVLCVMAYRQLKDITVEKYAKLKASVSKFIPKKFIGKREEQK